MSEWIRCEVAMPKYNQRVICFDGESMFEGICGAHVYPKEGRSESKIYKISARSGPDDYPADSNATHWMPFPEAPTN